MPALEPDRKFLGVAPGVAWLTCCHPLFHGCEVLKVQERGGRRVGCPSCLGEVAHDGFIDGSGLRQCRWRLVGTGYRANEGDSRQADLRLDRHFVCCRLTNRASAAGAAQAGAPCARSFYATRQAHQRNSSLLGRARQLQALVRPQLRPVAILPTTTPRDPVGFREGS